MLGCGGRARLVLRRHLLSEGRDGAAHPWAGVQREQACCVNAHTLLTRLPRGVLLSAPQSHRQTCP